MAKPSTEPVFLARDSYRRRRLGDAARLLPLFGLVLLILPGTVSARASSMVYIFGTWAVLIVLAALLAPRLAKSEPDGDRTAEPPEG